MMIHDLDLVLDLVGATPDQIDAFGVSILGENEDCAKRDSLLRTAASPIWQRTA